MRATALLLAVLIASPMSAASREKIATINVAASSLFTLVSCAVQGKVHSRTDALRCAGMGSLAGAGFYQAKRLAGDGHVGTAWLVANLSSSIVENTAAGDHPLGRIGYTVGPVRLRFATPAERASESFVDVDVSVVETGFMVRALVDADRVTVRHGMIWFETDEPRFDERFVYDGYTWGVFPGVWRGAPDRTRSHEAVHAVQSIQLDSVEPPAFTLGRRPRFVRLRHVRAGTLNLSDNLAMSQIDYEKRWAEIEAFRLTEDREPPR